MVNIRIYVLCYDDRTETLAKERFGNLDWVRIFRIPVQTHLFEGVMFQTYLMEMYSEWKDMDYVGTISYKLPEKVPFQKFVNLIVNAGSHDAVFFKVVPSDLFHLHSPVVKHVYDDVYRQTMPFRLTAKVKRYAQYNYWMARPHIMLEYIQFFNTKWLPTLENHPRVWGPAGYQTPAPLTPEQLLRLPKRVTWYPCHPFVNERLPYRYMVERNFTILE